MTEQSRADRRARPAAASLVGTASGASPARDAEPREGEITDLAQHRRRADPGAPLSAASAASVRDAAIAVLSGGVRYLPVVEDGTLVGVVALRPGPIPEAGHAERPWTAGLSVAIGERAR
jgi:CBS domain-containing protein